MARWFLILVIIPSVPALAAKRVTPPIQIKIQPEGVDPGRVDIELLTRGYFRTSYRHLATTSADGNGIAHFDPVRARRTSFVALRFSWQPQGQSTRVLILEMRAARGPKTPQGRMFKVSDPGAYFVIEERKDGNCLNLFRVAQKDDGISVTLRLPENYLACRDKGMRIRNIHEIGQRNINKGSMNLYKFDDDVRMGQQFAGELSNTPENPILKDPEVNRYIRTLIDKIGKASDMPELAFKVQVIDADVMNAFAVPGGYIWVYRGLIQNTETEAELVGVLAHEIAHVTSRHGTEGVTSAIAKVSAAMLAGELLAETTDDDLLKQAIQLTISGGTQFWIMGGTRVREAEADRLGAQYALRAGYDPRGIATLFDRWSKQRGREQTRLDQFFSDHPNDTVRVANVMREVEYFLPDEENLIVSSETYKRIKRRLARMAPPKQSGQVAGNALFSTFANVNQNILAKEIEAYLGPQDQDDD